MLTLKHIVGAEGTNLLDDYSVIDECDQRIGRIYRRNERSDGTAWAWVVYGLATYDRPPPVWRRRGRPAMAAFKAVCAPKRSSDALAVALLSEVPSSCCGSGDDGVHLLVLVRDVRA